MRSVALLLLGPLLLAGCSDPEADRDLPCHASGWMMDAHIPASSSLVAGNASWAWGGPGPGVPLPGGVAGHGPANVTAFRTETDGSWMSIHRRLDDPETARPSGQPEEWQAFGQFDLPTDNATVAARFAAFAKAWLHAGSLAEATDRFVHGGQPIRQSGGGSGSGSGIGRGETLPPGPIIGWSYNVALDKAWISGANLTGQWESTPDTKAGQVTLRNGTDVIQVDVGEWAILQPLTGGGYWWAIVDQGDEVFMVILPSTRWTASDASALARPLFGIGGDWEFDWSMTGGEWCAPPLSPPRRP